MSSIRPRHAHPSALLRGLLGWVDQHAMLLLWAGLTTWGVVFAGAAVYKLRTWQMGFDLGIHEQMFWNTVHGRIAASSPSRGTASYFGVDIIVTELLLAPLYALWQSPETLLIAQALLVPLGVLPLYRLAVRRLASRSAGLVVAALYLLALPVQYTTLYEFQIRAVGSVCFLWAFWSLETDRFGLFLLFACLAIGSRADAGFSLAALGIYAALHRRRPRWVFVPIVLGLGWTALCVGVLIPAARSDAGFLYSFLYGWLGDGPLEMLKTVVTRPGYVLGEIFAPGKREYLIELGGPLLFLFLLRLDIALIALPSLMLNLLSTERIHWSIHYHYQTFVLPWLLLATLYAIGDLRMRWRSRSWWAAALSAVLLSTCLSHVLLGSPLRSLIRQYNWERIAVARTLIARIPALEPLAVSNKFGPWVARRPELYFFPGNIVYPKEYIERSNWLLVDRREVTQNCRGRLDILMQSPRWQVEYDEHDFVLLRHIDQAGPSELEGQPPCGSEPEQPLASTMDSDE